MAWSSRFLLILLISSLAFGAGGCSKRGVQVTDVPPPATDDTTLGPGDVFAVRVYGEQELSGSHQVAPDGTIDFPSPRFRRRQWSRAAGRRRHGAAPLKERRLLRAPHVSVYVERYVSKRVSVVGAVANPGTFVLEPGMTVVEAISMAGGFSSLADRDGTVVTRRVGTDVVRYRVPVAKVANGKAKDIEVASGDIIFVPERLF